MAKEMQKEYMAMMSAADNRQSQAPRELQELDGRIARLRARLRDGDPDLTADELQGPLT